MVSTARFQSISASSINLNDKTYLLSPVEEPPENSLYESIRKYGLLYPPLLQEIDPDNFVIISGRKRIQAALQVLNTETLLGLVIPADSSNLTIYSLLLEHALIGHQLSLAEQIAYFDSLLQSCSVEDALPLFEKLGHTPSKHKLVELLSLKTLAMPALLALHHGFLHYNSARKMLKLSQDDQQTLVDIITRLHLGGSKQQKLIELCTELIMRHNEDLQALLHSFLTRQVNEQPGNIPQQSAALLKWLHSECFPKSSSAERRFNRLVGQLDLPSNIQVRHTPAFEDETITLCLSFPDLNSMQEALLQIREIIK